MKKTILYLANIRLPTEKAHGIQIMKMCEAFSDTGAKVVLVVPNRYNTILQDPFSYYSVRKIFEIVYLPTLDLIFAGRIGFWIQQTLFSIQASFYVFIKRAEIVYSRDELPLFFLSILLPHSIFVWEAHINRFNFNTIVSALMILANDWDKRPEIDVAEFKILLKLLAPIAPHLAEELWSSLGEPKSIHLSSWPIADPQKLIAREIKIVIQVNGKVRTTLNLPANQSEEIVIKLAMANPLVNKWLSNYQYRKVIYLKDKLLNFVV